MQKWEYKKATLDVDDIDALNIQGEQGWEMVYGEGTNEISENNMYFQRKWFFIFKRPIQETNN